MHFQMITADSCRIANDPKHTSKYAREYFLEQGIYWWKTPAESPDYNPIENLWHDRAKGILKTCN